MCGLRPRPAWGRPEKEQVKGEGERLIRKAATGKAQCIAKDCGIGDGAVKARQRRRGAHMHGGEDRGELLVTEDVVLHRLQLPTHGG